MPGRALLARTTRTPLKELVTNANKSRCDLRFCSPRPRKRRCTREPANATTAPKTKTPIMNCQLMTVMNAR